MCSLLGVVLCFKTIDTDRGANQRGFWEGGLKGEGGGVGMRFKGRRERGLNP